MQLNFKTKVLKTLSTDELADIFKVSPNSIRAALCRHGHYLGMKPTKPAASNRLLWSEEQAIRVMNGLDAQGNDG